MSLFTEACTGALRERSGWGSGLRGWPELATERHREPGRNGDVAALASSECLGNFSAGGASWPVAEESDTGDDTGGKTRGAVIWQLAGGVAAALGLEECLKGT